jgi:hypothetical protein
MNARHFLLPMLLFWSAAPTLRAQNAPLGFTLDLPFGANQATPSWLGHPSTPAGTFASLSLPVTPPDGTASLLVTVFYQEQMGGFLRIGWQGASAVPPVAGELPGPGETAASSVLCDNFYEGIGMSNQRSLLVPVDAMKQPGALTFQVGAATLGISRIKLEWLETSTGLSSPTITDVLVTPADGKTRTASELNGQPPLANDPAWHDRIVDVPITDVPLRIEQGVDFSVQMDSVPTMARIALKEGGLPWGQHLVVWVNGKRSGVILPTVPQLGDDGYPADATAPYIGWRDGTYRVPLGDLAVGNNTLQFSAEPDVVPATAPDPQAAPAPLAVKDVVFQLDYPAASTATASAVPVSPAPPPSDSAPAAPPSDQTLSGSVTTPPPTVVPGPTPVSNVQNPALLSLPDEPASSTSSSNTSTP